MKQYTIEAFQPKCKPRLGLFNSRPAISNTVTGTFRFDGPFQTERNEGDWMKIVRLSTSLHPAKDSVFLAASCQDGSKMKVAMYVNDNFAKYYPQNSSITDAIEIEYGVQYKYELSILDSLLDERPWQNYQQIGHAANAKLTIYTMPEGFSVHGNILYSSIYPFLRDKSRIPFLKIVGGPYFGGDDFVIHDYNFMLDI